MPETEVWTVGRLLEWTTAFLRDHGSESPRLDAEILLAEARKCPRIALYTAFEEVPDEPVRTAFRELVRRRAQGTPVAYLVGRREFFSLNLRVTPDVLIPRPETEFVVLAALDLIRARGNAAAQVIDIGTGSGAIAIALAKHAANSRITAVDISREALAVAEANVREHSVSDRVELLESDLFAAVPQDRHFDLVVSNPPYVAESEFSHMAADVVRFEPRLALVSGPTGTEVYERLIPQAAERLAPGGHLVLEVSPMVVEKVRELIAADGRFELLPTGLDLARLPRVVSARRKA